MGLGADFDITQSPFYNKIVILGVAIEVLHDVKSTPFYNYMDLSQLTPGMETHANAIQTILHENYIKVFGGKNHPVHGGRRSLSNGQFFIDILLMYLGIYITHQNRTSPHCCRNYNLFRRIGVLCLCHGYVCQ